MTTENFGSRAKPSVKSSENPPAIWRTRDCELGIPVPGVNRYTEVIYDETPGYVGCLVRSWLTDGYVEWDYESRRYAKTNADGGWSDESV